MLNLVRREGVALLVAILCCSRVAAAALPVIPGAAGFGIDTPAGRGGKIIRVTNLSDSGEGSLRECVKQSGPRFCVFEVSGVIQLNSNLVISNPNLTIAGQTAPAPGIMLRDATLIIEASDVLIQHLAVRAGYDLDGRPPNTVDSLAIRDGQNIVIDHCSFSWAPDENLSVFKNWQSVTISNTIVSESIAEWENDAGTHAYGSLIKSDSRTSKVSYIGNLFAHNNARNPRSNAAGFVFVNNVVYNYGSTGVMLANNDGIASANSIVGNVFIEGRNTITKKPVRLVGVKDGSGSNEIIPGTQLYLSDNQWPNGESDPWSIVENQSSLSLSAVRILSAPIWPNGLKASSTSGGTVLNRVLSNAGSRPAQRDSVDARIVNDVKKGSGQIINCVSSDGTSRCQKNAGGWPSFKSVTHSLKLPSNPNGDDDGDGYTNMEAWLHTLAAAVEGGASTDNDDLAPPLPPTLQD